METEIYELRENCDLDKKTIEEIEHLTKIALVDSNESQRIKAIRRLSDIFQKSYGARVRSGFQGDNALMLSYYTTDRKEIYQVRDIPLNGLGEPISVQPFLISNRGIIHFPYKRRCGFEELK